MEKGAQLHRRLESIFQEVFGDDSIRLEERTTSDEIEQWDSLRHVQLLARIESEFQIKFDVAELVQMESVGDLKAAIADKSVVV